MKTTKLVAVTLLLVAGACMSSCSVSDNEKSPEQVEDPIKDITEYYIVGQVKEGDNALSGVTVSTSGLDAVTTDENGQFTLTVNEQKEYVLDFAKDGYLQASTSIKLAGLTNRSSVAVSVLMTKKAKDATIADVSQNVLIESNGNTGETEVSSVSDESALKNVSSVGAYIPKEVVEEGTKVSMTEYIPEVASTQVGQQVSAPIMAVYIETQEGSIVASEENPVILSVNNPATAGTAFQNVTVLKSSKSRADEVLGEAVYDVNTNSYNFTLNSGELNGNYEFRISSTRTSETTTNSLIKEGKVDNSGNFEAQTDVKISYTASMGWTYVTAPSGELAELVKNAIVAQEGAEGTYSVNYEETTNVSGNSIMYWKAEGKYDTITYSFPLSDNSSITATLKKYTGVTFSYINTSADQHSGGTSTSGNAQ